MHDALLGSSAADIAGRWRDQQVWIGGSSLGPAALLLGQPVVDSRTIAEHLGIAPEVLEALDRFSARAGRRARG